MAIYSVHLDDGGCFFMDMDPAQATSGICANVHNSEEDCWQITPFQTADARHDPFRAASMVNDYFRDGDDMSRVVDVERQS